MLLFFLSSMARHQASATPMVWTTWMRATTSSTLSSPSDGVACLTSKGVTKTMPRCYSSSRRASTPKSTSVIKSPRYVVLGTMISDVTNLDCPLEVSAGRIQDIPMSDPKEPDDLWTLAAARGRQQRRWRPAFRVAARPISHSGHSYNNHVHSHSHLQPHIHAR